MVSRRIAPVILAFWTLTGCTSGPPPPDESSSLLEVEVARAEKDRSFREDSDSPIPPDKRTRLLPLPYYPPDLNLSVPASLKLSDERPIVEMPTSTGTRRRYRFVGALEFSIGGQPMSLGAFSPDGEPISTLFVPFADATTGTETYSAGRYLDVHPTATGLYKIDFNRAYNPYCAYNASFECPFPPPSNRLKVPIRAGERAPGV